MQRHVKARFAILIMTLLVLSLLTVGCSKNNNSDSDVLTVAMDCSYPPFNTKDKNGDPAGLEVDLIKDFGKSLGKDVVIEDTAWDGLIPSLQTGKADVVISSVTITDDREDTVDFSNPYARMVLELLVNTNSPVQSYEELNNKNVTIAVKNGTVGYFYAKSAWPNAKLELLDDASVAMAEVKQGKVDAFIYDELSIYNYWSANKDTTRIIPITEKQLEANDFEGYIGIAVASGNDELRTQLNDFIKQYDKDGGYEKLSKKYFGDKEQKYRDLGFVWFFDIDYQSYDN